MDAETVSERLVDGVGQSFAVNEEARAFNLLASFQLLELALKIYIRLAYDLIRLRVAGFLHFEHDEKAIEKASLERLLAMFKVVNGNGGLKNGLSSLVDKRNDIAHRMLLPHFGVRRRDEDLRRIHEELKATENLVDEAMKELAREMVALKSLLASFSG